MPLSRKIPTPGRFHTRFVLLLLCAIAAITIPGGWRAAGLRSRAAGAGLTPPVRQIVQSASVPVNRSALWPHLKDALDVLGDRLLCGKEIARFSPSFFVPCAWQTTSDQ